MPQITYETGRAGVQITPVQYNVQPNLSASRAIEQLEKGILGAMQLGGKIRADIKEENYQVAALDQKKRHEAFQTEIAGMSYPDRKAAVLKFNEANAKLYDENSKFGRQLSVNETAFQGAITQNLKTEGVEYEYLDNQTSQNNAFLDAKSKWLTATREEKVEILKELKSTQIDPLATFEDKYSKKLLANAQTAFGEFQLTFDKEEISQKNNTLWGNALEDVVSHINRNGTLDAETRDKIIKDRLGNISTYGEKGNELRQKLDEVALNTILAKGKEMFDAAPSFENAKLLQQNLLDYAKVSPKVKGSDTYTKTLNAANSAINAANTRDLSSFNSLTVDDGAPKKAVEALGTALKARGVISEENYNAQLFMKDVKMQQKNVTPQIAAAYQNKDMASLGNFMKNGRGGTVTTVVTDNLQLELAALLNTEGMDQVKAIGQIMAKAGEFAKQGIFVNKIDVIENIYAMPKNGGIKTKEDAQFFVSVVREGNKNKFNSTLSKEVQSDYLVLESWLGLNVQDIVGKFQDYKINPVKAADKDVEDAYKDITGNDEWWSFELSPTNDRHYRSALIPAIRSLIKAGVDPATVGNNIEAVIDANFIKLGNGLFSSGSVLMPKVGALNSEDAFKTVNKAFKGSNVLPMNVFEPKGDWLVINEKTGATEIYPFTAIEYLAKFGKLPSATTQ